MHHSLLAFINRLSRAKPRVKLVFPEFREPDGGGPGEGELGDLLLNAFNLPPEDAIKAFEAKGYKITWSWKDMKAEAHAKAFTVAKVMKLDILKDIQAEVKKSIEKGTTLETFQENLMPTLKAKGWWGKVPANQVPTDDPTFLPPGAAEVQLGSPWRLKTIFRTNLQTAYMAGRYQGMKDTVAIRPYWQYIAVMDAMTRPAHAAMNGRVFPHDDPIWNSWYPPAGYNCRCRVRSLSARELQRYGLEVSRSDQNPPIDRQGRTLAPDEGFDYNPGEASRSFLQTLAKDAQTEVEKGLGDPKLVDAFKTALTTKPTEAELEAQKTMQGQSLTEILKRVIGQKIKAEEDAKQAAEAAKIAAQKLAEETRLKKEREPYLAHDEMLKQTKDIRSQISQLDKEIEALTKESEQHRAAGNSEGIIQTRARIIKSYEELKTVRENLKAVVTGPFKTKDPSPYTNVVIGKGRFNPSEKKKTEVKAAIDEVVSFIHPDARPQVPTVVVAVMRSGGRAYYSPLTSTIFLSSPTRERSLAHEMGHWIDYKVPNASKNAAAFLAHRTQGERPQRLKDIFPGSGYKASETTKKDKFPHAYMGKSYSDGKTECTSMALEMLLHAPEQIVEDREIYSFIYCQLKGLPWNPEKKQP